jgi:hypothetical protein
MPTASSSTPSPLTSEVKSKGLLIHYLIPRFYSLASTIRSSVESLFRSGPVKTVETMVKSAVKVLYSLIKLFR